jgi:cytoskeletal protein CcmA (bactofilin family)
MKKISILLIMIMAAFAVNAQVAINKDGSAPDAGSILHVKNTSGSQFIFSDTDGNLQLQSHESGSIYAGNAYIDFGNSNSGYSSVGRIGKTNGNSNLRIHSNVGLNFTFSSGSNHRMTGTGLALGKTVPSEMLDVAGNADVSGNIDAGGDITANGDLWGTNGNLTDNLDVGGTGDFGNTVSINSGSNIGLKVRTDDGFGVRIRESDDGNDAITLQGYSTRGCITMNENGTRTIQFDADPTIDSYIDAGNFGIGTNVPGEKLEVDGNTYVSGNIDAGGDITANGDLWGSNGFLTNNLEVSGNVAINTSIVSAQRLAVDGGSSIGINVENSNATYGALRVSNGGGGPSIFVWQGDIQLRNSSSIDIDGTGEVNRNAQGDADLVPIAYGTVKYDGTIYDAGTGNWSASWNSSYDRMEITITGENYYYQDYTTVVTPIGSSFARMGTTGSVNNKLTVTMWDASGNKDTNGNSFSFIVYKH